MRKWHGLIPRAIGPRARSSVILPDVGYAEVLLTCKVSGGEGGITSCGG